MTTLERMRLVDKKYGEHAHQRAHAERIDALQTVNPCAIDHAHSQRCYDAKAKAKA